MTLTALTARRAQGSQPSPFSLVLPAFRPSPRTFDLGLSDQRPPSGLHSGLRPGAFRLAPALAAHFRPSIRHFWLWLFGSAPALGHVLPASGPGPVRSAF